MIKVNALKVRQKFGAILKELKKKDEPILIEKGREPVAVLISIEMFNERFVDFQSSEQRASILKRFEKASVKSELDSLTVLREFRYD